MRSQESKGMLDTQDSIKGDIHSAMRRQSSEKQGLWDDKPPDFRQATMWSSIELFTANGNQDGSLFLKLLQCFILIKSEATTKSKH